MKRLLILLLLIGTQVSAQTYFEPVFDFGYNVSRPAWPTRHITGDTLFHFSSELGNIWQPHMQIIRLHDEADRERVAQWAWYDRQDTSRQTVWNGDSLDLFADGVMQTFTFGTVHPWFKGEFMWSARLSVLKGVGYPLVDDATIEAVHQLFGQDDPFGRRVEGFNNAGIEWTDWDGMTFSWRKGEWKLQSIDLGYRREVLDLPIDSTRLNLKVRALGGVRIPALDLNQNLSGHVGVKAEVVGHSLYYHGWSGWGQLTLADGRFVSLGDGASIGGKEFYTFIDLGITWNNLKTAHGPMVRYSLSFMHHGPWIPGAKQKDNYGDLIHQGHHDRQFWNVGAIALYNPTQFWILSRTGPILGQWCTIYLMEDLRVNNAPDVQVGAKLFLWSSNFKQRKQIPY